MQKCTGRNWRGRQARNVGYHNNMAGRGTDIKLGAGVADAGGLAIVSTERHESRRVDSGRAGRQERWKWNHWMTNGKSICT